VTDDALHAHAASLLRGELLRQRGALGRLTADRRVLVEASAAKAVTAVADAVLDQAGRDPALAAILGSIYGDVRTGTIPVPPAAIAD
jgi:hypothetical protein